MVRRRETATHKDRRGSGRAAQGRVRVRVVRWDRQGRAGEEREGLDLWGRADVGGTVAAEAEGTSGAGCLLGTTPAFPVASGGEEANPEFRGGPHSSPKRRRGGFCNQLACLTRPSLYGVCGGVLDPQPTAVTLKCPLAHGGLPTFHSALFVRVKAPSTPLCQTWLSLEKLKWKVSFVKVGRLQGATFYISSCKTKISAQMCSEGELHSQLSL